MADKTQATVEWRLHFITFLLIDGCKNAILNHIWIMGKFMNILITHKKKKIKNASMTKL